MADQRVGLTSLTDPFLWVLGPSSPGNECWLSFLWRGWGTEIKAGIFFSCTNTIPVGFLHVAVASRFLYLLSSTHSQNQTLQHL